ncbi:hypothetical protein [Spirulina subsalsa]|uniref:hypothetical protein n=1 Tax=Spirulina subsalsa TaxID=54311 RepID=UPI0008FB1F3C
MSHASCPCCSSTLLRHIRHSGVYWYCSHCHSEMPNFAEHTQRGILGLSQVSVNTALVLQFERSKVAAAS